MRLSSIVIILAQRYEIMQKKYRITILFIILFITLHQSCLTSRTHDLKQNVPRDTRIKIGPAYWYTGETDFEIIKQKAREEHKYILMIFCLGYCPACEQIREDYLEKEKFNKVIDNSFVIFL